MWKIFSKQILVVAIFIFVSIALWLCVGINELKKPEIIKKVDTVISVKQPEIKLIPAKEKEIPYQVVKYKKSKAVRDSVVKSDIITYVKVYKPLFSMKPKLEVSRIDTAGLAHKDIYDLTDYKNIDIDHIGSVKIKRKSKIGKKIIVITVTALAISVGAKLGYNAWQKKHY